MPPPLMPVGWCEKLDKKERVQLWQGGNPKIDLKKKLDKDTRDYIIDYDNNKRREEGLRVFRVPSDFKI